METELYSIADISRMLNVPESTVRYYRAQFSGYIPVVGRGRTRKYPSGAVEIFAVIAEKSKAGLASKDVEIAAANVAEKIAKRNRTGPDMDAIRDELELIHSELKSAFERVAENLGTANVSELLTASDFTAGIDERFRVAYQEIDALKEQFCFFYGEFAEANKKLDEISKLIQSQRDRDITNALRRDKRTGWFKK